MHYHDADEHLDSIMDDFVVSARSKYRAGQREHGGELWRKNVLYDMEDEVVDLVIYFHQLKRQHGVAESLLGMALRARTLPSFLPRVQRAYNILRYGNIEGDEDIEGDEEK